MAVFNEEWLCEQIIEAKGTADESRDVAPNSYGAGYDYGYYDALCFVLNHISGGGRWCEAGHVLVPQSVEEARAMNLISEKFITTRDKGAAEQ